MTYPQNFEQKIGFDSIRQLLKEKCLSTLGQERVFDMTFSESYDEIDRRLEEITEFIRIIQEEDEFPDQYFFDVRPSLKRIRVEGMYMEEQELFDLRRSLETIRDIVRFLQRNSNEEGEEESGVSPYPYLRDLAGDIIVFTGNFGHCVVVESVNADSTYVVTDSNLIGGVEQFGRKTDYTYGSIINGYVPTGACIGCLHFPDSEPPEPPTPTPLDPITISIVADITIKKGGNVNAKLFIPE